MAGSALIRTFSFQINISAKMKVSASKSATSPSCKTLPAMLGRPYRTTRFDRQKIDICKTNGKAENRKE